MSIANWLTFLRILLIPVFVAALMYCRLDLALASFVLAAITDALDGFVARRTKVTTLGRFLDPVADKLLLASAFIVLPIVYQFPVWISVVVVSRDVIIALGYLLIYLHWGSARIKVRPLGKLTTFLQSLFVAGFILSAMYNSFETLVLYFAYTIAVITGISGADYILQGFLHANELQAAKKENNNG